MRNRGVYHTMSHPQIGGSLHLKRWATEPGTGLVATPKGYLMVALGSYVCPTTGGRKHTKDYAHRLVYALMHGADWERQLGGRYPPGTRLEVSHLCGHAWCLNPQHLRVYALFRAMRTGGVAIRPSPSCRLSSRRTPRLHSPAPTLMAPGT